MKLWSLSILLALVGIAGCTVQGSRIAGTSSGSMSITGNWELTATSTQTPYVGGVTPIEIYLTSSGEVVSGIAWVPVAYPALCSTTIQPCVYPFEFIDRQLSGTINADGNIALSSEATTNEAALSITAKTSTGTTLDSGTYTIIGSNYTDQGTITGNMIAPLNGTYSGTVVSSYTGQSMGVTTTLNQAAAPDAKGVLRVTGSASFTGSSCFTQATMQGPAATYSGFLGSSFTVSLVSTDNSLIYIEESGTVSQDPKTIQFHYGVVNLSGNGCAKNDSGSGTLTLQ